MALYCPQDLNFSMHGPFEGAKVFIIDITVVVSCFFPTFLKLFLSGDLKYF